MGDSMSDDVRSTHIWLTRSKVSLLSLWSFLSNKRPSCVRGPGVINSAPVCSGRAFKPACFIRLIMSQNSAVSAIIPFSMRLNSAYLRNTILRLAFIPNQSLSNNPIRCPILQTHSVFLSTSLIPAMKMSWRLWIGANELRKGFQNSSATAPLPYSS